MSRHAASIGMRRLARSSTSSLATFACNPSTQGTPIPSPSIFAVRLSPSSVIRYHHASPTNTLRTFAGTTAPLVALGLRRAIPFQHGAHKRLEGVILATLRSSVGQRRCMSDGRHGEGKRPDENTRSTGQESAKGSNAAGIGATGKQIVDRLTHYHRPTKQELLAAATGFWHRMSIHFKWFSIRSARPFNFDEIFAFASWIFWGHVVWIILGTTTFVSLAIFAVNTVFAQETLAGWVGNYLTKSSGVKVVFESAIVPKWNDGVITFSNVFVSRRPGKSRDRAVSKGSSAEAAAAAAASHKTRELADAEEDTNYTQFDVTIESVNVTLSFTKWFNGKGLLRDVEVRGVRGVVDRTHVHSTGEIVDPKSYRHEHHLGDFEIDSFEMEDVLITVYQPKNFRPFTVSVYSCELPRLRKQWLFYDFLSANHISGSFDNSLFTIHPRQVNAYTGASLANGTEAAGGEPTSWKKQSRLRIDGLKIDHLNRGVSGPFSWIHEGNVDIVADLILPHDGEESIAKVMSEFYDRMEATVTNAATPSSVKQQQQKTDTIINNREIDPDTPETHTHTHTPHPTLRPNEALDTRFVIFDLRVHLNDVRASVPLFTKDLSYVNNALVRPIVAYINSKRAFIPVSCRVVKRLSEFDGSWTIFDSGLLDDMSRETYDAFSFDIMDSERRSRRMKKVGLWTLQVAAQALFLGLAGQLA